jgi:hypothetical protein
MEKGFSMDKQFHELALIFPALDEVSLSALVDDIREHGLREAIWLHGDGRILDGRNRYIACMRLGIEPRYRVYDGDDALGFVVSMNLSRRHMDESQRAMVGARLATLRDGQKKSAVQICTPSRQEASEMLSVGERSISSARKVLDTGNAELVAAVDSGKIAVSVAARLTQEGEDVQRRVVARVKSGMSTQKALKAENVHVGNNSGENEWYTPAEYIDSARKVMGKIDLDPASSEIANRVVGAEIYYTVQDDGLSKDWHGCIWMNPPYSQPEIGLFANKLVESLSKIDSAMVLINNATETKWFQGMLSECSGVCFPSSRVKFLDVSGNKGAPLQGQAVLYFGKKVDLFLAEFSKFGVCLRRD